MSRYSDAESEDSGYSIKGVPSLEPLEESVPEEEQEALNSLYETFVLSKVSDQRRLHDNTFLAVTNLSAANGLTNDMDPFRSDLLEYGVEEKKLRWSVSWSDLMMTMFIFFAVLYIYKAGNREFEIGNSGLKTLSDSGSGIVREAAIERKPSEIYEEAHKTLIDKWVNESVSVNLVKDKAVRITLSGDLFFDQGKADLKKEAEWELRQIAEILRHNSFIINVVGHTDSVPNHSMMFPTNWELSTARACRVARFLIEDENIEDERFFVSGYSWHQPLVPNDSPENRALNRRVEIILMKEVPYRISDYLELPAGRLPELRKSSTNADSDNSFP